MVEADGASAHHLEILHFRRPFVVDSLPKHTGPAGLAEALPGVKIVNLRKPAR
jgi:hypothetical protein